MNEKLIEEAASAIHSVAESGASWGDARMADKDQHRAEARAALSVFEKALGEATVTPTDDEREDMIAFLLRDHNFEESPWGRTYTDAEIANALRRSEVPEPSEREAKVHGELVTMRVTGWRRITDELARLRTLEGQLEERPEPSTDSHVFVAPVAGTYEVTPSGLRLLTAEPQGEPSDAQVEAAARAIADHQGVRYNSSLVDTWDGMARAALRAAGGVR